MEEFEEKINKIHLEKKEQEITAKNARAHQENVGNFETFMANGSHSHGMQNVETAMTGQFIKRALSAVTSLKFLYPKIARLGGRIVVFNNVSCTLICMH